VTGARLNSKRTKENTMIEDILAAAGAVLCIALLLILPHMLAALF
jgi:hypothetical protein